MKKSLFAMFAVTVALTSIARAQYREEAGALEQIYESRLRTALNTVFRPAEYSVVVAVDIDRDPKRLADVEAEMDKMSLPGVPGLAATDNYNVSNKLHDLKNRIDVHLVLDEALPKEKEETAKALARMKLHLDESAGDTLTVVRELLVPKEPASRTADLLPELSWRMWTLVVLVTLLTAGAIFLVLQRKRRSENDLNQIAAEKKDGEEESPSEEPVVDAVPGAVAAAEEPQDEMERDQVELYERKRALLDLSMKFPEAASKGLAEEFEKGNQEAVLLICEELGWETAKGLYTGMSHRTWAKIGAMMVGRTKAPELKAVLAAVDLGHRAVVAKYLELTDGDDRSPFSFLAKLPSKDQARLLASEQPQSVALVCVFLNDGQKSDLLEALPEEQQQATLLHLSKLKEIPYESVRFVAEGLRSRLKAMQENPSVVFDGQRYLVELLNKLDVEAEQRFLEKLRVDEPEDAEALRRTRMMFEDLTFIPQEVIGEAVGGLDLTVVTQSLFGADENIRAHVLASLPQKRAKMIEKDLAYLKEVSRKEILSSRRSFSKAVQAMLLLKGKQPGSYFDQSTDSGVDTQAA